MAIEQARMIRLIETIDNFQTQIKKLRDVALDNQLNDDKIGKIRYLSRQPATDENRDEMAKLSKESYGELVGHILNLRLDDEMLANFHSEKFHFEKRKSFNDRQASYQRRHRAKISM